MLSRERILQYFPAYYADNLGITDPLIDTILQILQEIELQIDMQDKDARILFSETEARASGEIEIENLQQTNATFLLPPETAFYTLSGVSFTFTQDEFLLSGPAGAKQTYLIRSVGTGYDSNVPANTITVHSLPNDSLLPGAQYKVTNLAPTIGARPGMLHELARNRGFDNTEGMPTKDIRRLIRVPPNGVSIPALEAGIDNITGDSTAKIIPYYDMDLSLIDNFAIGYGNFAQNHYFHVEVPSQTLEPVGFALGHGAIGYGAIGVVEDAHEQYILSLRQYIDGHKSSGKEFTLGETV